MSFVKVNILTWFSNFPFVILIINKIFMNIDILNFTFKLHIRIIMNRHFVNETKRFSFVAYLIIKKFKDFNIVWDFSIKLLKYYINLKCEIYSKMEWSTVPLRPRQIKLFIIDIISSSTKFILLKIVLSNFKKFPR